MSLLFNLHCTLGHLGLLYIVYFHAAITCDPLTNFTFGQYNNINCVRHLTSVTCCTGLQYRCASRSVNRPQRPRVTVKVSICCVVLTTEMRCNHCDVMTILFSTFLISGTISKESHVSEYRWLDLWHLTETRFPFS